MIESKQDLRLYIREDKKRNLGAYKIGALKYIGHRVYATDQMKAFRLLRALRRTEYAKNCLLEKGLFGKLIYALCRYHYHRLEERFDIAIGTNMIGYGFKIPHVVGGGIIINCNSMGCYCSANVGVIVGNNHAWNDRPVIGDYVRLTTGCKVIGGIHIGNHVTVAPNSVVIKDVPDNCVVSGVPVKIIKKDGKKYVEE